MHENCRNHYLHSKVEPLLTDEDYRELQNELIARPETGKVIRGSGGIRKLRWAGSGRGKRGDVRVIYYWIRGEEIILMILISSGIIPRSLLRI